MPHWVNARAEWTQEYSNFEQDTIYVYVYARYLHVVKGIKTKRFNF